MAATVALIILVIVTRIALKRIFRTGSKPDDHARCRCGYVLDNLSVPRCPECGRVDGFNATAEELGLSNEELEQVQAAKARRMAKM